MRRRHDSYPELETEIKKADVVEHPEVFHHVGLLIIEPPPVQTSRAPYI